MPNPYLQNQQDAISGQVNNTLQRQILPGINRGAVAAGGYGGSRQGIAQGMAINGATDSIANATANLQGQSYEQDQNRSTQMSMQSAQLAAQQNGGVIGGTEIAQFATAVLVSPLTYDLTSVTRAALGTTQVAHAVGASFVLLDNTIRFIPIDAVHIGKTLLFRPVSFGTAPENSPIVPFVFQPVLSGAPVMENYTDDLGAAYTDDAGQPYFKVT